MVHAGPQEVYVSGLYTHLEKMPGNVGWHNLYGTGRYLYKKIRTGTGFTPARLWVLARPVGTPGYLTLGIYADNAGTISTKLAEVSTSSYTDWGLSEWINVVMSPGALSGTTDYWIVLNGSNTDSASNYWKIGVDPVADSSTYATTAWDTTPDAATVSLYYRLVPSYTDKTAIFFEYKLQQYCVLSGSSGAPSLYMMGDRGSADSNAGQLTKLIDATKTWTTDQHAGKVVKVIAGPGVTEAQPWRYISSNDGTSLTVSPAWEIQHTTATDYVIMGSEVTEISSHGLTAPVTSVLVDPNGFVAFAQGESVNIRQMAETNSAGTWTRLFGDDGTNKASYLAYEYRANVVVSALQTAADSSVGISFAPAAMYGVAHVFATEVHVTYNARLTGLLIYPDQSGDEVAWVMTDTIPYNVPGDGTGTDTPYPVNLPEMRTVRYEKNGSVSCTNGVYLYFNLLNGIQRYYNGQFDSIGPDLDEGLPEMRRGIVTAMLSLPGKFHVAIDAGANNYSSILDSDGWHERYRAPRNQRIRALGYQVVSGEVNRMWIYQGGDLLYIPFPSSGANELEEYPDYPYTHEFAIVGSKMHAGILDVQKMLKQIKIMSSNLYAGRCWFEMDYRLNDDETWIAFSTLFTTSPTQSLDLTSLYGIAGKAIQLRIRGYTSDNTQTPILLASIIYAVLRTDVKYSYPLNFRLMDYEPLLSLQEEDTLTAAAKLTLVENWADSSTTSMLLMTSVSPLFHNKLIFLNPPNTWQILHAGQDGNTFRRDVYICSATAQEA